MVKPELFVSRADFIKQLKQAGLSAKESREIQQRVFDLFFSRARGKPYISKKDAGLVLSSLKKAGPETLKQIILSAGSQATPGSVLGRQIRKKHRNISFIRATARFLLKNFAGVFGKLSRKRIGEFSFSIEPSLESGNLFDLKIFKGTSKIEIARINFDFRIDSNNKPVLVVGNFQGNQNTRKEIEEFSRVLLEKRLVKKPTSAFRFLLDMLISEFPAKMRVETKNLRKMPFMKPHEGMILRKLIDSRKMHESAELSIPGRLRGGDKIPAEGVWAMPKHSFRRRTQEENEMIAEEKRRIATAGYRMHRAVFDQAGFRRKNKKKKKGVLVLKKRTAKH